MPKDIAEAIKTIEHALGTLRKAYNISPEESGEGDEEDVTEMSEGESDGEPDGEDGGKKVPFLSKNRREQQKNDYMAKRKQIKKMKGDEEDDSMERF